MQSKLFNPTVIYAQRRQFLTAYIIQLLQLRYTTLDEHHMAL